MIIAQVVLLFILSFRTALEKRIGHSLCCVGWKKEVNDMKDDIQQPHIVKEFQVENTRIKIADNTFAEKSSEEVKQILKEVARVVKKHVTVREVN